MKFYCPVILIPFLLCAAPKNVSAQDSSNTCISKIPSEYFDNISKQASSFSNIIDKKSTKLLQKLQRREAKLKGLLAKTDSLSAANFFAGAEQKYKEFSGRLAQKITGFEERLGGEYMAGFDSLKGSLSFLNSNKNFLSPVKSEKLNKALNEVKQLQNRLGQADAIKEFIRERKRQIQEMLSRYTSLPAGAARVFGKYESDAFYYAAQVRNYKETFRDPDKLQRIALTVLNKIPAFQQFMKEHSELSGLFSLPGNYGTIQSLIGLQTRVQVQQAMAGRFGNSANAGQMISQQVQAAQSQLDQFKQKLNALGGGSGDIDMPDFKPNSQKTRTLFQRLEYSANMESTKSSYFFPSTTDISLMVGYRIDDKKTAGLGLGGKIGWGKDIRHIVVTGEGLNFRSFIDIQIPSPFGGSRKGANSFYATGGFEYNFQKPFSEVQQLYRVNDWTKSGLLGITKIVSLKSKVFKKTKLQLLWDWLSYSEKPGTQQPVKFRVGYNF
jgi:hypothetical protein